jgi:aromatic-amino-acid transaminase
LKQEVSTIFSTITDVPTDAIFGINDLFLNDSRREKVNLTVGIFIEEDGKSAQILPSVRLAEEEILRTSETKNYLPIDGDLEYIQATKELIFGKKDLSRIYGAQTIGGTSALRILADFVRREISKTIYISDPTWENHENIFRRANFNIQKYSYPDHVYEQLEKIPDHSVVLLHAMCHNPTGKDLSFKDWEKLEIVFKQKQLIPFFDSAYQGFGKGIEEDAFAMRHFLEKGHECFVAHSYSKSFSLYGERVGALFVVMKNDLLVDRMKRNIRSLIRTNYSNPPRHGAHIVKLILQTPKLRFMWEKEIEFARKRMQISRKIFSEKIQKAIPKNKFSFSSEGNGFFALLGLTDEQSNRLRIEFGIYLAPRARVNLTALTTKNIDYVVESIAKVL